MKKTRIELELLTDAELFAVALNSGLGNKPVTRAEPTPALTASACYGCGYSDTFFWTIPYVKNDTGLPSFSADARETVIMILAGEHWATWKDVTSAEQALAAARKAHADFLTMQKSVKATPTHVAA